MSSPPNNVQLMLMEEGFPDYQQLLYYMAGRLRAAILHCRDKPMHPEFLDCLKLQLGLAYAILAIGSTVKAIPHCPAIIGHISRTLVRLNVETGGFEHVDSGTAELMRMLPCHEAGGDMLLDEYQWAWWLQLEESEGRPPLPTLIDTLNAFNHDQWQLTGQPKPIQPPPPIELEAARRFLTTWQGWIADFIDNHVKDMHTVRETIIKDGFQPPENSPRALLEQYRLLYAT